MVKKLICLSLISSCLTGCLNMGPNQTGGHLIGGLAGAAVGSQFGHGRGKLVGTALGTLAGAFIGGSIGQKMDERDRALAQNTMIETLEHAPDYSERGWRNPNNQHSGRVQVTRTTEMPHSNLVCRDYVHTVNIDGRPEKLHGRACRDVRDPRASWMIE